MACVSCRTQEYRGWGGKLVHFEEYIPVPKVDLVSDDMKLDKRNLFIE